MVAYSPKRMPIVRAFLRYTSMQKKMLGQGNDFLYEIEEPRSVQVKT